MNKKKILSPFDFKSLLWVAASDAQAKWEKTCSNFYKKLERALTKKYPSVKFSTEPYLNKFKMTRLKNKGSERIEYDLQFKRNFSMGTPKRIYSVYIEQDGVIKLKNGEDTLLRRWWYEDKNAIKEIVAAVKI